MMSSESPKSIAHLSLEEKRAMLKQLLLTRAQGTAASYPLSHGQRALWFLHLMAPDTPAYNIAIPASAAPSLDLDALQRAFDQVLSRHESLRCVVKPDEKEPVQEVRPATMQVRFEDLRTDSPEFANSKVVSDHRRPFALDREVPVRASVYRTDEGDILLITAHHIAFDAWSANIFIEELRSAYAGQTGRPGPALTPVTAKYRDYVLWQRQMLGQEGQRQAEYWASRLSGDLPILRLPFSKMRPVANSFSGGAIPLAFERSILDRLRLLAQEERTTLFSVLLAAWGVQLALLSGDDEIVIGVPVSGRTQPEWAGVVGYFVNTLPIRLRIQRQECFRAHLRDATDAMQEALAHQDYPFSLMVERLKVRRDMRVSPVFQTMLNLHRAPIRSEISILFQPGAEGDIAFGPSRLRPYLLPQQEGQFDLVLELLEGENALGGHIKFSDDAMHVADAAFIRDHFLGFLSGAIQQPDHSVARLGRAWPPDSGAVASRDDREELVL